MDAVTLNALLERRVASSAPAISAPGRPSLTYAELPAAVHALAGRLRVLGIGRRDRVALVVPNGPEALTAFLGIAVAAVCAPLNPVSTEAELDFYLGDLGAKALVLDPRVGAAAGAVARARGIPVIELGDSATAGETVEPGAADDVALVLHTSGTTARPKLVQLTHRNLCLSAANIAAGLELDEDDRCLNVMPLHHVHGLIGAGLASLAAGAGVVCAPGFHAGRFHRWLADAGATWYTAVPAIHQAVVARGGAETGSLRLVRSSSSALPRRLQEGLEAAFGAPVIQAYGMTEASHQIATNPLRGERKPGSVGLPAGSEVSILDGSGEVVIRGPSVFSGYAGDPAVNEAAFTGGWFRTGDRGYLDEDGYLFLTGRLKELINRGGEKISPGEVEEALLEHPAVAEACAFAVPDDRLGEDVGAAIVLRAGNHASVLELQETVAARLAPFKVPRVVELVDAIPRGATGKVQRTRLAETLGLGTPPSGGAAGSSPTERERELALLWAELLELDPESIGRDDNFFALGGDSLLAAQLTAELESRFDRELPGAALVWAPTVRALAAWLDSGTDGVRSAVVRLRTEGAKPPFFLVPCVHDGGMLQGAALTGLVGADRPFYCLVTPETDGGAGGGRWFQETAAANIAELRRIQERGPYFLGGVGHGGLIALEMARRLDADGEEVGLVALIDPPTPGGGGGPFRRSVLLLHDWLESALARRLTPRAFAGRAAARIRGLRPPAARQLTPFQIAAGEARKAYSPAVYPGRIAILHSLDAPAPRWFWAPLAADGLEWHELPVIADETFRQPQIELLGSRLRELLDRERRPR